MRRSFVLLVLFSLISVSGFADTKKANEKIRRAETEFARGNVNGAEKNLRQALEEDPNSIDAHLALADLLSQTRRNFQAAQEYTKALELDASQKKLTEAQRRSAIDQQAISYALGGELKRARDIYLEALKSDGDYAMYNYNLACVYAEMNDLNSALPYLRKSWEHRDTLPSGVKFPDPRKDDSFKAFWNDARFQKAVSDIVL
ncbi:MAG TPA: tetratricopeptide repeat protein [Terriglobales bacterium]|nr:tetratricopeptide repeat protein [Terriglobales bacterium]